MLGIIYVAWFHHLFEGFKATLAAAAAAVRCTSVCVGHWCDLLNSLGTALIALLLVRDRTIHATSVHNKVCTVESLFQTTSSIHLHSEYATVMCTVLSKSRCVSRTRM